LKKCEENLKGYFDLKKSLKKPIHLSKIYYEFPEEKGVNPLLTELLVDLEMTEDKKYQ